MIPLRPLRIANLILAALLVYLAYTTLEGYWRPEKKGGAKDAESVAEQAPAQKRKSAYSRYRMIERANIFMNRDAVRRQPVPTPVPPTPPPLPPLKLELKGTTISRRDGHVKAIVHNKKTKKIEFYGKDDVIPDTDGARITAITRERIVLDREGQEEILQLYPQELDLKHSSDEKIPKPKPGRPGELRPGTSAKRLYN